MNKKKNQLNVVIYGAGAIGSTLGGWLTKNYENIFLLARGENAKVMKQEGLILYENENNNPEPIPVKIIEDLDELIQVDVVIITVKNYSLEEVAQDIQNKLGNSPIIVALQNGVENQSILPKYFSKVIYGVLVIGAWQDKPGVFGTRGKNLIVLGTKNNENLELLERVTQIFNLAVPTKKTDELQNTVHTKLILNLVNSIFTLINPDIETDSDIFHLWQIFVNTFNEGVKIVRAAGYKEYRLRGVPQWNSMEMAVNLDMNTAVGNFKKNLKFSWRNSMTQDMVLRHRNQSELESLNGYILSLADSNKLIVPYNRTIYELCKDNFSKDPYEPIYVKVVCDKIQENVETTTSI